MSKIYKLNEEQFNVYVKKGIVTPVEYDSKYIFEMNSLWNYDMKTGFFFPITNEIRFYIIYMHILPTSIYIGQTGQNPEDRWQNGKGYVNNKLFYINIKKYGWENIEHVIFKDKLTKNEADRMEMELIHFFSKNEKRTGKTVLNLTYNEI